MTSEHTQRREEKEGGRRKGRKGGRKEGRMEGGGRETKEWEALEDFEQKRR